MSVDIIKRDGTLYTSNNVNNFSVIYMREPNGHSICKNVRTGVIFAFMCVLGATTFSLVLWYLLPPHFYSRLSPRVRLCHCPFLASAELALIFVSAYTIADLFRVVCSVRFQFPFKVATLSFMNVMGESIYGYRAMLNMPHED